MSSRPARSPRGSGTTARGSTPGSWRSVGRAAGRAAGTARRAIPASRRCSTRSPPRRSWTPRCDPDRTRRLRRPDLRGLARAGGRLFQRLPELDGGRRAIAAMRAHPDLLRGPVAADVVLIKTLPGWVAKGGAEGLFCAVSPDGVGIALKVEDGTFRAILPALAEFLARLGVETDALGDGSAREQSRRGCRRARGPRRVPNRMFVRPLSKLAQCCIGFGA